MGLPGRCGLQSRAWATEMIPWVPLDSSNSIGGCANRVRAKILPEKRLGRSEVPFSHGVHPRSNPMTPSVSEVAE